MAQATHQAAIVQRALIFATLHCDPPRFAMCALLGGIADWLTRRYRSLPPAIGLHAPNNTIATILHNL